jgi:hypothetical protein
MALIEMTHPNLPGQVGQIDEEGFPEFAAKGWRRVDTPTEDADPRDQKKPARRPAVATTPEKE